MSRPPTSPKAHQPSAAPGGHIRVSGEGKRGAAYPIADNVVLVLVVAMVVDVGAAGGATTTVVVAAARDGAGGGRALQLQTTAVQKHKRSKPLRADGQAQETYSAQP